MNEYNMVQDEINTLGGLGDCEINYSMESERRVIGFLGPPDMKCQWAKVENK